MGSGDESCYHCRRPLREADFEQGRAIRVGSLAACEHCAGPLLDRLTPEQRKAIFRKLEGNPPPEDDGAVEVLPPDAAPPEHATSRRARAPAPRPAPAARAESTPPVPAAAPGRRLLVTLVAAAAILLVLVVALLLRTDRTEDDPGARKAAAPPPRAEPPRPAAPPAPDRRAEEAAARNREATRADIAALEQSIRARIDAQDFPKAGELLDAARGQRDAAEWGQAVDRLRREVRDAMDGAFLRLKSRTEDACRLGDLAEAKKGRDEVARWGVPRYAEELEKVLAEHRPRILQESLAGCWKLDETSGSQAADATVNHSTGQVKGKPSWVAGKIGGGLRFDAEGDYVELPIYGPLDDIQAGSFTATAWFMPSEVPTRKSPDNNAYFGILVKSGCHMGLAYNNGQGFQMDHWLERDVKAGVWVWDTRYEPGRFHHVAGVVDLAAGKTLLYVNGKRVGATTWKAGTPPRRYNRTPWRIGIANPEDRDWRWPARGVVDDVRLYRRALSDDEILLIFERRDPPAER